jgi:hypothetical protein
LSTGAVTRLDAVDGDFTKKYSNTNITAQSLTSAVSVVTLSGVTTTGGKVFITFSWQVRNTGARPAPGGVLAGYEIRRGTTKINSGALTATKVNEAIDDGIGAGQIEDEPPAGTYTYSIYVYATGSGIDACECRRAEITASESRR